MLTQWLEIKARGCCRHVFLVIVIDVIMRLRVGNFRLPVFDAPSAVLTWQANVLYIYLSSNSYSS